MLIHGYTGAIDIVDSNIVNAMNAENISSVLSEDEISLLSQRGYLTNKTVEEEQSYVAHFADVLHRMNSKLYKNFGFVITYDCNFRCPYCFENIISKHGTAWSKRTMTKEMVDKAYDAMLKIEPHRELHSNNIILYGGEPLLRENREIVEYIIKKGHNLGYKFKAITNGYDLNYYSDLISPKFFKSFQISIDGFREKHNSRKFHFKEGDSFDKVISNISLAIEQGINTSVRINFDRTNIGDREILIKYFEKIGFTKNPNFTYHAAKVDDFEHSTIKQNSKLFTSLDAINNIILGDNCFANTVVNRIIQESKNFFQNKTPWKLCSTSCSAQYGSYMFDPYGDIYPCLEIVGQKKHCIGIFSEGKIEWNSIKEYWHSYNVGKNLICKECKYALLCGGMCRAKEINNINEGDLTCTLYKSAFSRAINYSYSKYIY